MDIPDVGDITEEAKKLADTTVGEGLIEKAKDIVDDKVAEVEKIADERGLGGVFDKVENMIEEKTGMDIDGDGDIAK